MEDKELDLIADRVVEKLAARLAGGQPSRAAAERTPDGQRLFGAEEAAIYLGRSVIAVRHMMKRGTVPITRIDGRPMVDKLALDKLIASCTS